jgi:hypothetical protein
MKPFNLDEFIEFCRSKGNRDYDPSDVNRCALAQFGFPRLHFYRVRGNITLENVYFATTSLSNFAALTARLEAIR